MNPLEFFFFIAIMAICAASIVLLLRIFHPFQKDRWIVQIVILTMALSVPPVGAFVLYRWDSFSRPLVIQSADSPTVTQSAGSSTVTQSASSPTSSSAIAVRPDRPYIDFQYSTGPNNDVRPGPGLVAASSVAPSLAVQDDPRLIGVLFATNRVIDQNEEGEIGYDQIRSDRSPELRYGTAIVRIPEIHHIGKVERPSDFTILGFTIWRTQENQKNHFTLKSTKTIPRSQVIELLEKAKDEGALGPVLS
jgi:hypothetical protein